MGAYSSRLTFKEILLFAVGVFVLMFAVYHTTLNAEFVQWDDDLLVFDNPAVQSITPWSLKQIFTTYDPELYIPLTLFTYQLNSVIGGSDPLVYHLTNIFLHGSSAIALAGIMWMLTRKRSIAIVTSLLFAIHPLHTEAVSWISARKDVLALVFFLLCILTYLVYADREKKKWWHISLACFLCALLSKVIAITLPVVLVLFEMYRGKSYRQLLTKDTIPYFGLSIIFGIVAILGKEGQASVTTPIETVLMAFRSTAFYLQKIVAPMHLSVIYPETGEISLTNPTFLIAATIVIGITGAAFLLRKRYTELWWGWLVFIVTLGPTYPLYRKGFEGGDVYFASDRYAYIPSIAIIILLVLALSKLLSRWRGAFATLSTVLILSFSFLSYKQSFVWKDSVALFTNAISLYPTAQAAHNNLGMVYYITGDLNAAEEHFNKAVAIRPLASTYANLGSLYRRQGQMQKALTTYQDALRMSPNERDAYFGLGILFSQAGEFPQAELAYQKAIELDPSDASTYLNLGVLYMQNGQTQKAIDEYQKAIERNPFYANAFFNLGMAYKKLQRTQDARDAFEKALRQNPSMEPARQQLQQLQ